MERLTEKEVNGLRERVQGETLRGVPGDRQADERRAALRHEALRHEDAQAQRALGERGIWKDDAVWLPEIDATQKGLTLRRLMCEAIESALSGESAPKDALRLVQTTMDAM